MTESFDDTTDGQIVDELGALKAQTSDLAKPEKALKGELIQRLNGFGVAEGALFRAAVSTAVSWVLDTQAIKVEMPEEWLKARTKKRESTTVRVSAQIA